MRTDELAGYAVLSGLTEAQCASLANVAAAVTHSAGERIFEEGGVADGCWLIRSGRVALLTEAAPGPLTLQTLGRGDVLGWSWLVPPYRWRFTAVAAEPVDAVRLDGARLRGLIELDPALGYALAVGLLQVLAERLSSTRARLLDLYGSPRER